MEYKEFYQYCTDIFDKNDYLPPLDNEKAEKLYLLTQHMLEVNKTMNLTAIKDEKSVILRHYADSLAICNYIKAGASVIDVGCGAGFPTIPLAIFRPDISITALDSTQKRIDYVTLTAKMLNVGNVTAIAERAEVLANNPEYREKFDYATARAVASLPILAELCLPFVKPSGQFISMKSVKAFDELDLSINAIAKCGGRLNNFASAFLTDLDGSQEARTIILIDKIVKTPKEFPRHYSKISKKPL